MMPVRQYPLLRSHINWMGGHLGQVYCTFEGIQETVDDVLPQRNTELASACFHDGI